MAEMTRADALTLIDASFPDQPIVVTLGTTVREMLAAVGQKDNHLYILDSMGLPGAIGLGLAMGLEGSRFEKVVTVEGDGSLLMGFSILATIGMVRPQNFLMVVLDNGTYGATGGQPTGASHVDFVGVSRAAGWDGEEVGTPEALRDALRLARGRPGPFLIRARIGPRMVKSGYFLPDPVLLADTFTRWVERNR
ncbi:MAG: phosphonopyruvate decarboxylase [Chloroflexi bacterium]|nr:phosphonopyruvate decarboxylase [Chloroflexota bacterium]